MGKSHNKRQIPYKALILTDNSLSFSFEVISDNPTPSRRLLSLGGRLILLDIEVSPNETPVQVSLQLASYDNDEPNQEIHSIFSKNAKPNINTIILHALKRPRLDHFAKIFSFLACADRIYAETEFNVFPALDEISNALFKIQQAQIPLFADQSTSWYGAPELNPTDMVGTGLWYWQGHRHAFRALERKVEHHFQHHANIYKSLSSNGATSDGPENSDNSKNLDDFSTQFHDPFTHNNITSTVKSNTQGSVSAQAATAAAEARAQADRKLMAELTGLGNKDAPYHFQRYLLRLLVRPVGDTAVQHIEHLDPPPVNNNLDAISSSNQFNGSGRLGESRYAIKHSRNWLPQEFHINESTGLVENWDAVEPDFTSNTVGRNGGECVLMLEPPVFLPYHIAAQMNSVSDSMAQSYLSAAFVSSQRRMYGPKKHGNANNNNNNNSKSGASHGAGSLASKEDGSAEKDGSVPTNSTRGSSELNYTFKGSISEASGSKNLNKSEAAAAASAKKEHDIEDGTSVLLGNGYAHCPTSSEKEEQFGDEDTLDLNVSFTSLVPYSFVKVVEIPIAHPQDLPGIILNLRKAILIDTFCRSLNLHETVVQENANSNVGMTGGVGLQARTGQGSNNIQVPGVAVGLGRKSGAPGGKGNAIGSNGAQVMISSNNNGEVEEGDEAMDSDLLLLDTLLEAANKLGNKQNKDDTNFKKLVAAAGRAGSFSEMDAPPRLQTESQDGSATTGIGGNEPASAELKSVDKALAVNVSLVEENNDVHITVAIPSLNHFSFWITPTLKAQGILGVTVSHMEFAAGKFSANRKANVNNDTSSSAIAIDDDDENLNGDDSDLDLSATATKLATALELTEDLGLVCRYLSHKLYSNS